MQSQRVPTMPNTLVVIQANLNWRYLRGKGGNYVAVCDPLKLTLQAETFSELVEEIGISMDSLLKDLLAENELNPFMREHGWTALTPIPAEPQDDVHFDIPYDLVRSNGQQDCVYQ